MIQYFITIIIIIICLEVYIRYYIKPTDIIPTDIKEEKKEENDNLNEPWDKVDIDVDKNKYYIKVNNFDEYKFIEWKKLPIKIDYDIDNKYLIIKTKSEETALAVANLFICNMNNELDLQYIIDNDLINVSKLKAKTHKLVKTKLIELIKEGKTKTNDSPVKIDTNEYFDTNDITIQNNEIIYEEPFELNLPMSQDILSKQKEYVPQFPNSIQYKDESIQYKDEFIQNKDESIQHKYESKSQNQYNDGSMFSAYGGSEYATISFG